jgi:hypothetical protein
VKWGKWGQTELRGFSFAVRPGVTKEIRQVPSDPGCPPVAPDPGCPRCSLEAARSALALKEDYAEAYNKVGVANAGLGLWDAAIAAVEEALRLQPDFQLARNNLVWFTERKRSGTQGKSP